MAKQLTAPGIYRATITNWGLRRAGTGTTQFVLNVNVTDRAINDDDPDAGWTVLEAPIKRSIYCAITQATINRVIDEVKSIGFTSADLLDLDPKLGKNPHNVKDQQIKVMCSEDEYEGKQKERWGISRRVDRKLTEEQVQHFAALFGDTFKDKMTATPEGEKAKEEQFNKF